MHLVSCRLSEHATIPKRGSAQAAGYDLSSAYAVTIKAQGKAIVKTDLAIKVPQGCYGRIAPRSGLSWKHHMDVGAGVIDADYRGNVGVVLFNHAKVASEPCTH
jgi:dUTP pyrophosphatase